MRSLSSLTTCLLVFGYKKALVGKCPKFLISIDSFL